MVLISIILLFRNLYREMSERHHRGTKMNYFLIYMFLSLSTVHATNPIVQVAPGGSFTYSPSSLTAAVEDTIEFLFVSNL